MPLVRIAVSQSRNAAEIKAISEGIYKSMVETINVPENDNFQIITAYTPETLIFDRSYLGIERTSGYICIQIFLNAGRTLEKKRALYQSIADKLSSNPGVRKEDVFISLVEVTKENWSFGNGIASYADPTP